MFLKYCIVTVAICAIANASNNIESSNQIKDTSFETKKQTKRGIQQQEVFQQSVAQDGSPNFQSIIAENYDSLGSYLTAAASPQIYYVKAPPQSGSGNVQYAQSNTIKLAFATNPVGAVQPQGITYQTLQASGKSYPQYQLAFAQQPLAYSSGGVPAFAYAAPYQQISHYSQQPVNQVFTVANGYNLGHPAGTVATPSQLSQPPPAPTSGAPITSYVTVPPTTAPSKVPATSLPSSAGYYTGGQNQLFQPSFAYPAFHQTNTQAPNQQKLIAIPAPQYKPASPSPTIVSQSSETATSYAAFSQQLNNSPSQTAVTSSVSSPPSQPSPPPPQPQLPVKFQYISQSPHSYYGAAVAPFGQKLAFTPFTAASAAQPYHHNHQSINHGAIHYGTQLFHPTLPKYSYGPVAAPPPPPQLSPKLIYSH